MTDSVALTLRLSRISRHHEWQGAGVDSLSDVKGLSEEDRADKTVREVMARLERQMIVAPETSLEETLRRMAETNLGRLLVMRGDQMVGMITRTGLLRIVEIKRTLESAQTGR